MNKSLNFFSSIAGHKAILESVPARTGFMRWFAGHDGDLRAPIVTVASILLAWQLTGWLAMDARDIPTMSAANLMLATLFQGGRTHGAQRKHGGAHKAAGTMQALALAGLTAVTSILAAVLTHAATSTQAYI